MYVYIHYPIYIYFIYNILYQQPGTALKPSSPSLLSAAAAAAVVTRRLLRVHILSTLSLLSVSPRPRRRAVWLLSVVRRPLSVVRLSVA